MNRVLAPVLSSSDLPLPELCAARIDGEVFAIDECFATIDADDTPALRGAALLSLTGPRAVAVLESALWVHGLSAAAPDVHQVRTSRRDRVRLPAIRRLVAGTAQFHDGDVIRAGGMSVTTLERTVTDMLLADDFGPQRCRLVRIALDVHPALVAGCASRIQSADHLPGKHRALRRLTDAQTSAVSSPR